MRCSLELYNVLGTNNDERLLRYSLVFKTIKTMNKNMGPLKRSQTHLSSRLPIHAIDSSLITFQTLCLQLPTPRCHCSAAAAAEHSGKPGSTQAMHALHQTHEEK